MSFSILSIKIIVQFLGKFAKFHEEIISFVLSVHSSAHMENGSHWTDCHEIWYEYF